LGQEERAMTIKLATDVEARIRQKVENGSYADSDEVMREAMRLLDEQENQLAALRAKLQVGIDQLDRGEGIELTPALWDEIRQEAIERHRRGEKPSADVCP
jgi:antitoxin ParD1/3/4